MKCPKSIEIYDINYPYGKGTRYCPFHRFPCVLETNDEEKCGIATLLLNVRDSISHVFESTCEIDGGRIARHELDVSMNVDMAAENIVAVIYPDLARYFN